MNNYTSQKKLLIGTQNRTDTFTKKLGFVVYSKEDGTVKNEGHWKKWCDAKNGSLKIDNVPHAGFHLNKGVQRNGHWGRRQKYVSCL